MGNAMSKLPFKEVPVVPQMTVCWPGHEVTVYSFDEAWHLVIDVPRPAHTEFVEWVRRDNHKPVNV